MIRIENLAVSVPGFTLGPVSFEVPSGAYGVLMGRTGSGKTTIIECICGLRRMGGRIELMGRDVTRAAVADRGVGYVPQDRALFSTMTVRDHLGFALRVRKVGSAIIAQRVEELAGLLRLTHLLGRVPQGLSGGESQRVALGRALCAHPALLLLDEPLSALDDQTREEMYQLLKNVQKSTGVTVLHITHNLEDATRLADRLLLLENGRVHVREIPAARLA